MTEKSFITIGIPFCNTEMSNREKNSVRLIWTFERMLSVNFEYVYVNNTKKSDTQRYIDNSKRVDPGQSRMPINFNWLWLVQDLKLYRIFGKTWNGVCEFLLHFTFSTTIAIDTMYRIFWVQMEVILLVIGSLKLCTTSQSVDDVDISFVPRILTHQAQKLKHEQNAHRHCRSEYINFSSHLPLNWWWCVMVSAMNDRFFECRSCSLFCCCCLNSQWIFIHSTNGRFEVTWHRCMKRKKNECFVNPCQKQLKAKIGCSSWIISLYCEWRSTLMQHHTRPLLK